MLPKPGHPVWCQLRDSVLWSASVTVAGLDNFALGVEERFHVEKSPAARIMPFILNQPGFNGRILTAPDLAAMAERRSPIRRVSGGLLNPTSEEHTSELQ